jgi:hypothetical protein
MKDPETFPSRDDLDQMYALVAIIAEDVAKLPTTDKLEDMLDTLSAIECDLPSDEQLDETITKLDRIAAGLEVWNHLPSNAQLDETIAKLERIAELKGATK